MAKIINRRFTMENLTIKEIVKSALDKIENILSPKQDGLYPYKDAWLNFQKGELCVLASPRCGGKTNLALNLIREFALMQGKPCGLFTCGTLDGAAIGSRLLVQESGVNFLSIKTGMMNIENFKNLEAAAKKLYDAPIFINETPNISLADFTVHATEMVQEKNAQIIFIDDLDSMFEGDVNELKTLAKDLDIPIVALTTIPPDNVDRPSLESFSSRLIVPRIADKVLLLHQKNLLLCAKNSSGASGDMQLQFIPQTLEYFFHNK